VNGQNGSPQSVGWLVGWLTCTCAHDARLRWAEVISAMHIFAKQLLFTIQLANSQSRFCSETRTNLSSELQLTDGLVTDQLAKRSRNRPLMSQQFHAVFSQKRLFLSQETCCLDVSEQASRHIY